MHRRHPSFLGATRPTRVALPQLPAALEAAVVVAAVVGFGLGWAWLASPDPRPQASYPVVAMSLPESSGSHSDPTPESTDGEALPAVEEWLIDGFNLLHTVLLGGEERSRWWTASGRSRVLEAVAGSVPDGDHSRVRVVFDGKHDVGESTPGPIQAVFAPSADDWLVRRVKAAAEPGRLVVVTADRKLANRARHHGAVVVAPSVFLTDEA